MSVFAFWQNWEPNCLLRVLLYILFAYYSHAFGDHAHQTDYCLLEAVITQLTIMSFACPTQPAEYSGAGSFLQAGHWALTIDGFFYANGGVPVPLLCKITANL